MIVSIEAPGALKQIKTAQLHMSQSCWEEASATSQRIFSVRFCPELQLPAPLPAPLLECLPPCHPANDMQVDTHVIVV